MFKEMNRIRRNQKGFSIVEFMVISAIFGILAAASVPSVINYLEEEKVNTDNFNAKEMEEVILKNLEKGIISLNDGPESIAGLVKKELGYIPKPKQDGLGFFYYEKTGSVKVLEIGSFREGWKKIE